MSQMSKLFERSAINGMELSNRFVRSATWEGMAAEDGSVTPKLTETLAALAKGGVGLIISSQAYVLPEGQAAPWQLGIYKDELIEGLQEVSAAVHDFGCKIVMQIAHAGKFAASPLTGRPPLVVSDFDGLSKSPREEMTLDYIRELVVAFGDAARRAKVAGFDGVQIHSAHGYLLSQFLSPAFNRRKDDYGGAIENRARIHMEIFQAIRNVVGKDFPVLIKLNCRDFTENGLSLEDSLHVGRMLADAGLDAIELSGGLLTGGKLSPSRSGIKSEEQEAYFKEDAQAFKKAMNVPLILVGGMRSFEVAERLVEEGVADYISMSRPFIREPALVNRWKAGDHGRATCKSDNLCFGPGVQGKGIYCVTEEMEKAK
jgi:2,4-dienoyl-CoA reductase-like NADH-dependent reductase (Old Yellow Enzyme family)